MAVANLGRASLGVLLEKLWEAQGRRCVYTNECLTPGVNMSLDHRVPRSRGGSDEPENLQWVTKTINLSKNALTEDAFLNLCRAVVKHRGS